MFRPGQVSGALFAQIGTLKCVALNINIKQIFACHSGGAFLAVTSASPRLYDFFNLSLQAPFRRCACPGMGVQLMIVNQFIVQLQSS